MKIHDDHLYHGAALIQVAEDKEFTAINSLKIGNKIHRTAYKINDKIALYLKYASNKTEPHNEYIFTFQKQHLKDLRSIFKIYPNTYISLVCVHDREICCLSYKNLDHLIEIRKTAKGNKEDQYTVLVTAEHNKAFRVYVNSPGVRNTQLGNPLVIKRNEFPKKIFG